MEKSSLTKATELHAADDRLAKFRVFAGLAAEELDAVLKLCDTVTHSKGERIVTAGQPGHTLYVILSGSVRVAASQGGHEVGLADLSPGDFFGEIALVDDGPRSADVTATDDVELLRITRMTIGVLAGLKPETAIQLLGAIGRALVQRLRESNAKYLEILARSEKSE